MMTQPVAEMYVSTNLGLNKVEYYNISWEAMGNYFNTLPISKKVNVIKCIYNWQNVGVQKQLHNWINEEE
jgi:hypothetical protein